MAENCAIQINIMDLYGKKFCDDFNLLVFKITSEKNKLL